MNEQIDNDLKLSLSQALNLIKARDGDEFSNEKVNLAELQRLTNISRAKLRRLKQNGFIEKPNGNKGKTSQKKVLSGYEAVLNNFLKTNLINSQVCYERLQKLGYEGGLTSVKMYIQKHKHLIPAKRQIVSPQGNRGRRYSTEPGQSYQMDWGFVDVLAENGEINCAACFAMICHHCGQRFIEFFPNAKQENLFIGMIHGFKYMGIPKTVLTDNMKSVVNKTGTHRVYAECDPRNECSWKLLEKVGLQREAHFKQNIYFHKDENENPIWKDTFVYALVKEE